MYKHIKWDNTKTARHTVWNSISGGISNVIERKKKSTILEAMLEQNAIFLKQTVSGIAIVILFDVFLSFSVQIGNPQALTFNVMNVASINPLLSKVILFFCSLLTWAEAYVGFRAN